MTSEAKLTPKNAALIVIDYQPVQVNSIASRPCGGSRRRPAS